MSYQLKKECASFIADKYGYTDEYNSWPRDAQDEYQVCIGAIPPSSTVLQRCLTRFTSAFGDPQTWDADTQAQYKRCLSGLPHKATESEGEDEGEGKSEPEVYRILAWILIAVVGLMFILFVIGLWRKSRQD